MNRRAPWKRALLGVAALAGLLNLTACLNGGPSPSLIPVIRYSPEYQREAAAELRRLADPGNLCHAPHVLGLVLDYARTRDALRATGSPEPAEPPRPPVDTQPALRGPVT